MNAPNFLAGIMIVIVGGLLYFAGPQLIMIPSTQLQVIPLVHDSSFIVGDVWTVSAKLEEGIRVNGTLAVSSALTGEPSEVLMLVADEDNYEKWNAHSSPPTFVFEKEVSNGETFSFSAADGGIYHIILDNTSSPVKKRVTLNADLQKEFTVNLPDTRVQIVAYGVIAVGLLVTAVGVMRRTQIPWA